MSIAEIELVLAAASPEIEDLSHEVDDLTAHGRAEDDRLAELERRLGVTGPSNVHVTSHVDNPASHRPATRRDAWDEIVAAAIARLADRGIDPTTVRLDDLMDPDDIAEIRRSSSNTASYKCRLDLIDLSIAVIAGVSAAAVDATVVRIPRTLPTRGQSGSPLTEWLRSHAVSHDNALADLAKVPYDSFETGQPAQRLWANTHRVDTFGHDPLIGLVFGTIDILRGTSTGVTAMGTAFIHDVADPGTSNPLVAVVIELAHLLSDVGTKTGLPLPGWSFLRLLNVGSIEGQTISEAARTMYFRGYNSWHLLTMTTSVAAGELVLRSGWALRSAFDHEWRDRCDEEARLAGSTRTGTHPRFLTMALITHGIATLANAGKIAAYHGNPLAWNAPQWAAFARVVAKWWQSQQRSPVDAILSRSDINLEALLTGWPDPA